MEEKQRKRNEIEEKYKWDLSSIYSSKEEINKDINEVNKLTDKLIEFENKDINTVDDLINMIDLNVKSNIILEKLILYSQLKTEEDLTNSENQKLYGEIVNFITDISAKTSFYINKILKIDENLMNNFLNDEKIEEYKFYLNDILKEKNHALTDQEEKLISNLGKTLMLDNEIYDTLVNADMKFGFIIDENGNKIELTNSNVFIYLKSKDRRVRKETFEKFYSTYGKYKNTIGKIYSSHLETTDIMCKLRKYKDVLDADLSSLEIPKDIYDNLITIVNDNLNVLQKYYKLKKETLSIEDAHIYDMSAPLEFNVDKSYSYEEGQELILDIFKLMGEDYIEILKKAFNERWIDVYNNEGKANGAFSAGVYETNPYVLTNYEGKLIDVSTIVHELGHSVNTYLSKNNNSYLYYDYSLFMAEIASLTNEIVFNVKMIEKEEDKKIKLDIINTLIKLFNSNFFGATLDAEFELEVHNRVLNGEVLTHEDFSNIYYDLNKKYYGNEIIVDEDIKYRWEIYSHLYSDFYLFKYATGISCACYCASKILEEDNEFIENYKKFLAIGSSKYPYDALMTIGIDITKKDFMQNTIDFYNKLIDDYKKIYDEVK